MSSVSFAIMILDPRRLFANLVARIPPKAWRMRRRYPLEGRCKLIASRRGRLIAD